MKLTTHLLFSLLALVLIGNVTSAQAPREKYTKQEIDQFIKEYCQDPNEKSKCAARWTALLTGGTLNDYTEQRCTEAEREVARSRKAFYAACAKAGVTGTCEDAGLACQYCNGAGNDCPESESALRLEERRRRREENREKTSDRLKSALGIDDYYANYSEEKIGNVDVYRLGVCVPFAKQTAKDFSEQVEDIRKKLSSLKDEISDRQSALMSAKNALADAQTECQQKRQDLDAKFKENTKEMMRAAEEANKKRLAEISAINEKISQLYSAMRRREVEYYAEVATIEKICEDEAERKLNEIQAQRAAKRATNQLRARNLNTLLNTLTVGRVAEDEKTRQTLVAQCQQNGTKLAKPLTLLNNNYKADLQDLKEAIERQIQARESASQELQKNSQNWSQDYQDAQQEYVQAVQQLEAACAAKIGQCQGGQPVQNIAGFLKAVKNGNFQKNQPPNLANCSGLTGQVVLAQQDLSFKEEELDRLNDKLTDVQETYSDAVAAANGIPPSKYDADDFYRAFADYEGAIEDYNTACTNKPKLSLKRSGSSPSSSSPSSSSGGSSRGQQ